MCPYISNRAFAARFTPILYLRNSAFAVRNPVRFDKPSAIPEKHRRFFRATFRKIAFALKILPKDASALEKDAAPFAKSTLILFSTVSSSRYNLFRQNFQIAAVFASDAANATFQWYRVEADGSETLIEGATNATCTVAWRKGDPDAISIVPYFALFSSLIVFFESSSIMNIQIVKLYQTFHKDFHSYT